MPSRPGLAARAASGGGAVTVVALRFGRGWMSTGSRTQVFQRTDEVKPSPDRVMEVIALGMQAYAEVDAERSTD